MKKLTRICVVIGTRPEAIKLAPLIFEMKSRENFEVRVINTGQHKELLAGILELWKIEADKTFEIDYRIERQSLIPDVMNELLTILPTLESDIVVVQGDTATAAGAALAAHALRIPVAHIEAGLRSNDLWNPWPEESNRKIIDAISNWHFAPTQKSRENLFSEGHRESVHVVGNTVVDALIHAQRILDSEANIRKNLEAVVGFDLDEQFILFTQHRREGFGDGQRRVFDAVSQLARQGFKVVFPVHLNPSVRTTVNEVLSGLENIYLIPPQEYLPMVDLIRRCSLIITDSGGLQEEGPTFSKPILITRLTTERQEIIEAGFGKLLGFETDQIVMWANQLLSNPLLLSHSNPYGNGDASIRICDVLSK